MKEIFILKLPQCEILLSSETGQEILFSAGGRKPNKKWFMNVAEGKEIFCADRGVEICEACDIFPSFVVGDFDSAKKSAIDWIAEKKISFERHPKDKDFPDLKLALIHAEEKYKNFSAVVTGIFGGRFDHIFSTIFSLADLKNKIILADEKEIIFFLHGGEFSTINFFKRPNVLSLLPITEICDGVTIDNVHWQLDNSMLKQNCPNYISNRVEADKINIKISSGILACYLCFENFL